MNDIIERIRNREVAIKNDDILSLKKICKIVWPKCHEPIGNCNFYFTSKSNSKDWSTVDFSGHIVEYIKATEILKIMEEEKEFNPQRGDLVEVSIVDNNWHKRIFLTIIENARKPIVCVDNNYEAAFKNGRTFNTISWKNMRPIQSKLEVTVTLNGEKVHPSTISEETWNNLRK